MSSHARDIPKQVIEAIVHNNGMVCDRWKTVNRLEDCLQISQNNISAISLFNNIELTINKTDDSIKVVNGNSVYSGELTKHVYLIKDLLLRLFSYKIIDPRHVIGRPKTTLIVYNPYTKIIGMQYYKEDDTDVEYYGFPYLFQDGILHAMEKCGLVIDSQNTTLISQDKDNTNLIMIIKADIDPCRFVESLTYITTPDFHPILKAFNIDDNNEGPAFDKDSSTIWIDLIEIIKQYTISQQQRHFSFAIPPVPAHDTISILLMGSPHPSAQPDKILTMQMVDGNNIPQCSIPIIHSVTLVDFLGQIEGLGITLKQSDVSKKYDDYIVTLKLDDSHFDMVKNLIASLTIHFFHQTKYDLIVENFGLIYNEAVHRSIGLDDGTADVILNYVHPIK
jgi:hypothetical protein